MKPSLNKRLCVFFILLALPAYLLPQAHNKVYRMVQGENNFKSGYYFYNRRNFAAAINFFDKTISYNPKDYRSRIWLGQSYFMSGFLKNALTEWQTALNLGGGGNLLKNKINSLYFLQGKEDSAKYSTPFIYLRSYSGYKNKKLFFHRPTGVAVDSSNKVYIVGFKSGTVTILDANGKILKNITGLKNPFDIVITPDGKFFVSDFGNDRIVKYNSDGSYLMQFGSFGYTNAAFAGPQGISCDKHGNVYVVDSGNSRVQKFSQNGKFIMAFGKKGSRNGEFFRPSDVAVSQSGRIYVTDFGNSRIQLFDESGNFLKVIGEQQLSMPRGLIILADGRVAIADGRKGLVIYNPKNSLWNRIETVSGKVNKAVGLCADKNNMLYVADFDSYRVSVFVPERLKYVNLDVRITRTLEYNFPKVQQFVMVRDRDGRPITGLKKENFRVYERGARVFPLDIHPTYRHKKRVSMVFLVDKSKSMIQYKDSLRRVMKGLLKNLPGRDKVEVINFNSKVWISQRYISNILSPLEGAGKGKFEERAMIGRALYKGVSEQFKYDYRKALVLFTAADFSDEDYKPYGYQTCLHYAKNNDIPVYLVLFKHGKSAKKLIHIAKETGGRVFNPLTSGSVYKLREFVFKRPLTSYSLYYSTVVHPKLKGSFREFSVEVNYKGLFGYDKFGYYIPR